MQTSIWAILGENGPHFTDTIDFFISDKSPNGWICQNITIFTHYWMIFHEIFWSPPIKSWKNYLHINDFKRHGRSDRGDIWTTNGSKCDIWSETILNPLSTLKVKCWKIFPFFSWPQRGQLITLISPIVTHSLNRSLTHSNRYLLSRIVLQVIWQK